MRIKLNKKLIPVIVALVLVIGLVPAVAAYEGHLVNIKAHVEGPLWATRSPGYWKTHLEYTEHVFYNYLGGSIDLGWRYVDSTPELMGIFWASKSKNTNNCNRDPLCKARFKASWHALAAILSSAVPNGAPLPVSVEDIRNTIQGCDTTAMNNLSSLLEAYYEYYDDNPIEDCDNLDIMNNSDPTTAEGLADKAFADCP